MSGIVRILLWEEQTVYDNASILKMFNLNNRRLISSEQPNEPKVLKKWGEESQGDLKCERPLIFKN